MQGGVLGGEGRGVGRGRRGEEGGEKRRVRESVGKKRQRRTAWQTQIWKGFVCQWVTWGFVCLLHYVWRLHVCVCIIHSECVLHYVWRHHVCATCVRIYKGWWGGCGAGGSGGGEEKGSRRGGGVLTIQLALEAHYPHLQYFHIANPRLITVIVDKTSQTFGSQTQIIFLYISSMIPLDLWGCLSFLRNFLYLWSMQLLCDQKKTTKEKETINSTY